ncbi:MAG: hypothetical protein FJY91_02810 [Candidatus Harrisonbacteria bacterium]|nr:hypothetical protein [Candidatus Harrisonbacteria bacterium]
MKTIIINIITALLVSGLVVTVFAFTEPSSAPPTGNTPAPLHTGTDSQRKSGDLTVKNLIADDGITLGGVKRTSWPKEQGTCDWEGTKCSCARDGGGNEANLIIGVTCASNKLTNVKIVSLRVTSGSATCPKDAPTGCTPGLYNK